ncbi:MAG: type II secretion system protein GspM [Gammaproteobacteria bacterium]|jgi:type II secretory pathway component PulM
MKEKLLNYWHNLQPREQKLLMAAGVFLGLICLYLLIDAGAGKSLLMSQQLKKEEQLLSWMKPVVAQVSMSRAQANGEPVTAQNILPQVEFSLEEAGLSGQITELDLVGSNQVRISFDSVVYEALIKWLYSFSKRGVIIHEFTANKTKEEGVVQASMLLSAK